MPITTESHVALLRAAQDAIHALDQLDSLLTATAEAKHRGDDPHDLLTHLIAKTSSTNLLSRPAMTRATVLFESKIYTDAKIRRNEKVRDYMRNQRGLAPVTSAGDLIAEQNRQADAELDAASAARIPPPSLDLSDPPDAHLPLPPPKTGRELREEMLAKLAQQSTQEKSHDS
jgi:hypothetical protein